MKMVAAVIAAITLLTGASQATAQAYPDRGVTIIVPAPPGGPNDIQARLVAQKLQEAWGRPVVVQNKPGASLIIGAEFVARSAPDGYTLLVTGNSPFSVNPAIFSKLPYDSIRDFAPISMLSTVPLALVVSQAAPAGSVSELIAYAKENPGKLFYGAGSPSFRIAFEMFRQLTGTDMTHVPYPGSVPVSNALLSNTVQVTIIDMATVAPHVRAGKMRALAAVSPGRVLPNLPLLSSSVPGYDMTIWLGAFAPAGTPPEIVAKLNTEIRRIVSQPDMREKVLATGLEPETSTPGQLAERVRREIDQFKAAAKAAGMKPE